MCMLLTISDAISDFHIVKQFMETLQVTRGLDNLHTNLLSDFLEAAILYTYAHIKSAESAFDAYLYIPLFRNKVETLALITAEWCMYQDGCGLVIELFLGAGLI